MGWMERRLVHRTTGRRHTNNEVRAFPWAVNDNACAYTASHGEAHAPSAGCFRRWCQWLFIASTWGRAAHGAASA